MDVEAISSSTYCSQQSTNNSSRLQQSFTASYTITTATILINVLVSPTLTLDASNCRNQALHHASEGQQHV
jgi:hypothetical protein